jgi:hypothetical protein
MIEDLWFPQLPITFPTLDTDFAAESHKSEHCIDVRCFVILHSDAESVNQGSMLAGR